MNLLPFRKTGLLLIGLTLLILVILTLVVYFSRPNLTDRKLQVGERYIVREQINGYLSPTGRSVAYIALGKTFHILEIKGNWLKIKMIMPDGGDYGAEGWIKVNNESYEKVN